MSAIDHDTSSAVPEDLRAYSRAAIQIDEQIHQLALRLRGVLEAYRATNPEFGRPIPYIEDDLERYARRCMVFDRSVGQIADAFERAGMAVRGESTGSGAGEARQPVVVAEAAVAAALEQVRKVDASRAPRRRKHEEHHDHSLFGDLIHSVERAADTLGAAASSVKRAASDVLSTVEHVAMHPLYELEDAGADLVQIIEHLAETLDSATSEAEKAANEVAILGRQVVSGARSSGDAILHAVDYPLDTLAKADQAAQDFVTGFATGVKDMALAALMLARVLPGSPLWVASMALDTQGTVKLQEQFVRGLAHMGAHPLDALGSMVDLHDLKTGDYAKWVGHLTPDVIVALLTAGGGAAAAASEGIAKTAAETVAEDAAETGAEAVAAEAAMVAGRATPHIVARKAGQDATVSASEATTAEQVIAETRAGLGSFTSRFRLTISEALSAGQDFLGDAYTELGKTGSGVFRSADGLRQFRMDPGSVAGEHGPAVPHVHFEIFDGGTAVRPATNNHVPLLEDQ